MNQECQCVNNTQGSIWKFVEQENKTRRLFKLCIFCEEQIMQGKEYVETLSDHIYKKIQIIEEQVQLYKSFINLYEQPFRTIQQEINNIMQCFQAQIENLENILGEYYIYAENLLKNAQPSNQGIQFLKLEFEILPEELEKLQSQVSKYEKKLLSIKALQKKYLDKGQGDNKNILYDKILNRNITKNYQIDTVFEQKSNILRAQLFEDLEILAFSTHDKCLYIWNYDTNKIIDFYENQSMIYSIRFAAFRSCHLYVGDEDGAIIIFVLEGGIKLKLRYQFKEHQKRIQHLIDNSQNQIISSSLDNTICINEIFTGNLIRKIQLGTYVQSNFDYEYAVNLLVSPDGGSLKIWDADNFDNYLIQENIFDSNQEIQVQIANFGYYVLASCKREIKIFDLRFDKKIINLANILQTNYKIKNFYCTAINNKIVLIMDGLIQIAEIDIGKFDVIERIPFTAVEQSNKTSTETRSFNCDSQQKQSIGDKKIILMNIQKIIKQINLLLYLLKSFQKVFQNIRLSNFKEYFYQNNILIFIFRDKKQQFDKKLLNKIRE